MKNYKHLIDMFSLATEKFRGLYKRKGMKGDSAFINADVNGSYNILRKGKPAAFAS